MIVIHVCDEARNVNRDFYCNRSTLLAEMRYFRTYLVNEGDEGSGSDPTTCEEVDISVHCDVTIFEWLMMYITRRDQAPALTAATVVSILISSDFLEMDRLVKECVVFMSKRLNEIIRMPIDLSCISDKLLDTLADLLHFASLAELRDKKDKLLSKLYKRRLEIDFRHPMPESLASLGASVSRICSCKWCGKLFHSGAVHVLTCDKAPLTVDFRVR